MTLWHNRALALGRSGRRVRMEFVLARSLRCYAWLVGVLVLALAAGGIWAGGLGVDAHAYWSAWNHDLYRAPPMAVDAYLYSPAFAELIWPLTLLPWPVFAAVWLSGVLALYLWLLAPLPLRWRIPALLACSLDIESGNVWSIFAVVLVVGFRWPGLWVFPALTKVTPVLGPVWFAVRREWRQLAVAAATTTLVVAVSFAAAPHLWGDWLHFLQNARPEGEMAPLFKPPTALLLAAELPVAVSLTAYAALTDRRWLLPIAMVFANPMLTANALVVLAAVPRLRRQASSAKSPTRAVAAAPGAEALPVRAASAR